MGPILALPIELLLFGAVAVGFLVGECKCIYNIMYIIIQI